MRRLIPQYGDACLESRGNAFVTLARSIVGQQISVKAAQSVWDRFAALLAAFTPQGVLQLGVHEMRAAGLSARKVEYLRDLARHFDDGRIAPAQWRAMTDEAIISELVAIRGIGRWTAEMFLNLTTLLEDYDRLCEQYLKLVEETDLDQVVQVPPAPWYGRNESDEATMRYLVVHNLAEFARHAGHADIIRKQIDGAKAAELNAAVEGRPANKFVTPWKK